MKLRGRLACTERRQLLDCGLEAPARSTEQAEWSSVLAAAERSAVGGGESSAPKTLERTKSPIWVGEVAAEGFRGVG